MFATLVGGGVGLYFLLHAQGLNVAGQWLAVLVAIAVNAWVLYGLIAFHDHPWVRQLAWLIGGTVLAGAGVLLALSFGSIGGVIAVAGIWGMALTFFVGLYLARLLLTPGLPVFGVAKTLVDEAIRMKVPLIFIILLVLLVPVMPFALDPKELLRYRIQSFLNWSLIAASVLLSLMTVFLAVSTITGELQNRQIFLTMTKPVSRGQYLLGKWLGIMALNLVLVAVSGAAIYVFTLILARQPATSPEDYEAVRGQVLVARESTRPAPGGNINLRQLYAERLDRLRRDDPSTYGQPGDPIESLPDNLRSQVQQQLLTELFVVPPQGATAFRFEGLHEAKRLGERMRERGEQGTVQLRIRPQPARGEVDGFVYLFLRVNGTIDPRNPHKLAESQYHIIDVPTVLINDQGVLEIEIASTHPADPNPPSVSFNVSDGIELLYRVGTFEMNLVRSLAIMWIRLGFLAMLGLAAGTYLGFPVACLLALMVYFGAVGSAYLTESAQSYASFGAANASWWDTILAVPKAIITSITTGEVWKAIKIVIRLIATAFLLLVPSLSDFNPTPLVSDGRVVTNGLLGRAAFWIGVVWTGAAALIAWLIWRRRELARVTV